MITALSATSPVVTASPIRIDDHSNHEASSVATSIKTLESIRTYLPVGDALEKQPSPLRTGQPMIVLLMKL